MHSSGFQLDFITFAHRLHHIHMHKIETIHLFPTLAAELAGLLKKLSPEDWEKPTPIPGRKVKDLVSHLIDGSLRRLSMQRDGYFDPRLKPEKDTYKDLVVFIQLLNSIWMSATSRLSPRILIGMLEDTENELYIFFKTLHPDNPAFFPVAWAGETKSQNWFDIAREYTEKWHHQMQIRMALDEPLWMDNKYLKPVYDTFMQGVPHLFRELNYYPAGAAVEIRLTGILEKSWLLLKTPDGWQFVDKPVEDLASVVEIPAELAWIIWTNTDRKRGKYFDRFSITGDKKPALLLRDYVTVMS